MFYYFFLAIYIQHPKFQRNKIISLFLDCVHTKDIPEDVLNTYCWIHSTYTIPSAFWKRIGKVGYDKDHRQMVMTILSLHRYWCCSSWYWQDNRSRREKICEVLSVGMFLSLLPGIEYIVLVFAVENSSCIKTCLMVNCSSVVEEPKLKQLRTHLVKLLRYEMKDIMKYHVSHTQFYLLSSGSERSVKYRNIIARDIKCS